MNHDPIAATDQAVEVIKGVARIHCAYYLQCLESGLHQDEALQAMQTFMWVLASRTEDQYED